MLHERMVLSFKVVKISAGWSVKKMKRSSKFPMDNISILLGGLFHILTTDQSGRRMDGIQESYIFLINYPPENPFMSRTLCRKSKRSPNLNQTQDLL